MSDRGYWNDRDNFGMPRKTFEVDPARFDVGDVHDKPLPRCGWCDAILEDPLAGYCGKDCATLARSSRIAGRIASIDAAVAYDPTNCLGCGHPRHATGACQEVPLFTREGKCGCVYHVGKQL